jgi:hypothetical protein
LSAEKHRDLEANFTKKQSKVGGKSKTTKFTMATSSHSLPQEY